MCNVHGTFITYNIGISKNEKHLTTSLFRYETFYYLWVWRFFDIRREIHILSVLAFWSSPTQHVRTRSRPPRASESQPSSSEAGLTTNWLFQNPPNPPRASGAWRHPHSLAPFPIWAILTSVSDMSARPARVNTCVNVAPKYGMNWAERFSA